MRIDAGFENVGLNGDTPPGNTHTSRFFGGLGARIKAPITPTVAFVVGRRAGAVHFGHFNNVGDQGIGLYLGASTLAETSSDFLVVSGGNNGSSTNLGVNVPLGLLLQPDPRFALTLLAGYSASIALHDSTADAVHFVPLGVEAVVTPSAPVDIGLRFAFDGYVAESGPGQGPGYFDLRSLMLWVTAHGG